MEVLRAPTVVVHRSYRRQSIIRTQICNKVVTEHISSGYSCVNYGYKALGRYPPHAIQHAPPFFIDDSPDTVSETEVRVIFLSLEKSSLPTEQQLLPSPSLNLKHPSSGTPRTGPSLMHH